MPHDVFISYSSTDQNAALAVLHGLEAAGVRCWIAPRDIEPGAIWAQAIMEGIVGCRVMVVVFSANANRSAHVINEVDAAVRKGAIIVPFRIEDVMPDGAMEYHLRTRHWLDALTPDLEKHTALLAEQVRSVLTSHQAPGPTPTAPPKPFPADLVEHRRRPNTPPNRKVSLPSTPKAWRKLRNRALVGALLILGALFWWTRERPVKGVRFVVREVSGSGDNQTSMRITSGGLRFFETAGPIPSVGQRSYTTTFPAGTSRYVEVEMELGYEAPNRVVTVPLGCTLTSKGGQVITAITINAVIQPTWTSSLHVQGWGTAEGGWWKPDRYRADCKYGDKLIGRNWFEVTPGAANEISTVSPEPAPPTATFAEASPWREIRARVLSIRTFTMGDAIPEKSIRQATRVFSAAATGYVGIEVTMGFDAPQRALSATLNCRILQDRTRELGRMKLSFALQPNWRSAWSARGYGRSAPGLFKPGDYQVACDDGLRTLAWADFAVR